MATSPTGFFSLPIDYLRKTVAGSAAFRTATGAANATAALAFVHGFNVTAASELDDAFFAVVELSPEWSRSMHAGGTNNLFDQDATLNLWFNQTITSSAELDAGYDFMNPIGAILSEMEVLSGTPGYLDIQEIRLGDGPFRPEEDEAASQTNGAFYRVMFEVTYRGT